MGAITVTMPLSEYEQMRKQIETLKEQNISRFIKRDYQDLKHNIYSLKLDTDGIKRQYEKQLCLEGEERSVWS